MIVKMPPETTSLLALLTFCCFITASLQYDPCEVYVTRIRALIYDNRPKSYLKRYSVLDQNFDRYAIKINAEMKTVHLVNYSNPSQNWDDLAESIRKRNPLNAFAESSRFYLATKRKPEYTPEEPRTSMVRIERRPGREDSKVVSWFETQVHIVQVHFDSNNKIYIYHKRFTSPKKREYFLEMRSDDDVPYTRKLNVNVDEKRHYLPKFIIPLKTDIYDRYPAIVIYNNSEWALHEVPGAVNLEPPFTVRKPLIYNSKPIKVIALICDRFTPQQIERFSIISTEGQLLYLKISGIGNESTIQVTDSIYSGVGKIDYNRIKQMNSLHQSIAIRNPIYATTDSFDNYLFTENVYVKLGELEDNFFMLKQVEVNYGTEFVAKRYDRKMNDIFSLIIWHKGHTEQYSYYYSREFSNEADQTGQWIISLHKNKNSYDAKREKICSWDEYVNKISQLPIYVIPTDRTNGFIFYNDATWRYGNILNALKLDSKFKRYKLAYYAACISG